MKHVNKILVRKPEGKKPLGKPRCREDNNIRMDLREIGWKGVDWIHLAQNRDSCEHGNESLSSIKDEFLDYLSDSASQEGLCSME